MCIRDRLSSVILCCLKKTPAERYASAAEVREALKTIMKTLQLETGIIPGDAAAVLPPSTVAEQEKRTTGILSMLAERFRESSDEKAEHNTILVLPFQNLGAADVAPLYGFALADAIAARIARMSSLIVRPSSALVYVPTAQMDPLEIGQKLLVDWVLTGNFLRSDKGFDLNWQLLEVERQSVRGGGGISVPSFDLIAVQTEICNEVFASLQGVGQLHPPAQPVAPRTRRLGEQLSEEYLQARALLSGFMQRTGSRSDLDRARELFEAVVEHDPTYAPAWSGLGIAELQYTRYGFGGHLHVMAARKALDHALELDPGSVEANLYRVYMLLSRGEKESARHGIEHLLSTAANDLSLIHISMPPAPSPPRQKSP